MDRFLESEMRGAIFCDPNFVRNFLTADPTRLQTVLEGCEHQLDAVHLHEHVTREDQLYDPICQVLNIIERAVDNGPDLDQFPAFLNVSAEPIPGHYDDMAGIKPDLALFNDYHKLNPTIPASIPSPSSGKGKEREVPEPQESSLTRITKAGKGVCQGIDFRTGTPTFMSLRVLEIPIGQPYEHSFMDDLESFFWLILWCVLERVEPGNANPGVDKLLNLLCQPNLKVIAAKKSDLLAQCVREGGERMKDALAPCKDSWATDPMIINLILEMGSYFDRITRKKISKYTPVKVFPKIVRMIMDAFNRSESDSTDSDSD